MLWGPCGHLKFSSYSLLQVSFIVESLSFKALFLNSCRALFLSHVLPKSHPTCICTLCPTAHPALPPRSPTPCHSSPLCLYLTSFHFAAVLPSPFTTNPLLSHLRLCEALKSSLSRMGSGKPNCYPTQSSGKNPILPISLHLPLPSAFCLSWLLLCLLLN